MSRHLLGFAACALLAGASLAQGACFSPTYREGLACSESGECPGDLECIQQQCVTPDSEIGDLPDGGGAPLADAALGASDATACVAGAETIEATGAIVDFIVPACITSLTIEAFGAEGGGGVAAAVLGGKGARIKGDVAVAGGEVLQVLVGMRGADAVQLPGDENVGEQGGGSGGGGTFVVAEDGSPLMIAGGGGGATHITLIGPILLPGGDGRILSAGQAGDGGGGVGGVDGGGGGVDDGAGFHNGTGAGGFSGSGVGNSVGDESQYGTANAPGASFLAGGAGGVGGSKGRNGGFGGGGSAGFTGAGGGGYSGGGGGGSVLESTYGGGGGGSLNSGTNQDDSPGVRVGDGQVIITWAP